MFEPQSCVFEDHEEYKCHPFDMSSTCVATSASVKSDIKDSDTSLSDASMGEIHSQDSGSFQFQLSASYPCLSGSFGQILCIPTNEINALD